MRCRFDGLPTGTVGALPTLTLAAFVVVLIVPLLVGCGTFGAGGSAATRDSAATVGSAATGASPSPPLPLRLAVAADLRFAMDELVVRWRSAHPDVPVETVYGSSGTFFAQLSQGAPFDLFFSADIDYPRRLVEAGLADGSTLRRYAVGQLAVWVPATSSLDVEGQGLGVVLDPSVRRVAIANPEHAPYGRAALAALEAAGVAAAVGPKLVLGENAAQAAQFVQSGNADVGIIALSLARSPALEGQGRFAIVPPDAYPAIEQGAVVLSGSARAAEARAFLDFVLGPEGRAVLDAYGFLAP